MIIVELLFLLLFYLGLSIIAWNICRALIETGAPNWFAYSLFALYCLGCCYSYFKYYKEGIKK